MSAVRVENSALKDFLEAIAAGTIEMVDLTQPLSEDTPVVELPPQWVQIPGFSRQELSRYDERAPVSYKNAFTVGEHVGTHLDAPIHWFTGKENADVSQIPPRGLIGPAAVFDKVEEVEADPDFLLDMDDIEAFQSEHGPLPRGGWLLLRSGWSSRIHSRQQYLNRDEKGAHWPGVTAECARWIAQESELLGFGTETVGTDAGQAHALEPPFPIHHYLLGAGKCGLASLTNLDRLPPVGSLVVAAPLRIERGSGSPMRAFAFVPAE